MIKNLFFSLSLLLTASCATTTVNSNGMNLISESAYEDVVDKWTDLIQSYSGLNNTVSAQGTLLNSEVATAQVDQNARIFQWDKVKYDTEKRDLADRLSKQTEVFVSFYSPERKWDDLAKSKTLWKIYLDVNGQRYEGKAVKLKLVPRELQSLYHYHTSFSTPYMLTFPVSAMSLENKAARLILTGSVDSISLNFPPK